MKQSLLKMPTLGLLLSVFLLGCSSSNETSTQQGKADGSPPPKADSQGLPDRDAGLDEGSLTDATTEQRSEVEETWEPCLSDERMSAEELLMRYFPFFSQEELAWIDNGACCGERILDCLLTHIPKGPHAAPALRAMLTKGEVLDRPVVIVTHPRGDEQQTQIVEFLATTPAVQNALRILNFQYEEDADLISSPPYPIQSALAREQATALVYDNHGGWTLSRIEENEDGVGYTRIETYTAVSPEIHFVGNFWGDCVNTAMSIAGRLFLASSLRETTFVVHADLTGDELGNRLRDGREDVEGLRRCIHGERGCSEVFLLPHNEEGTPVAYEGERIEDSNGTRNITFDFQGVEKLAHIVVRYRL